MNIPARRKLAGLAATTAILLAHFTGVLAMVDDPNGLGSLRSKPAGATEGAHTEGITLDARVATLPPDVPYVAGDCSTLFWPAMRAGWTWDTWPTLARIMWRESRCEAHQTNFRNRDRSYGLLQLNTRGTLWTNPIGWGERRSLREMCGLTAREELLDAAVNLRCGRLLYEVRGWRPWA